MFASTQDLEFVQGQSRDVPDLELGPNSITSNKGVYVIGFMRLYVSKN